MDDIIVYDILENESWDYMFTFIIGNNVIIIIRDYYLDF